MDPETTHWIALGGTLIVNLGVALIVLHVKNSVTDALNDFRRECDEKYESKELATERHNHVSETLKAMRQRS